jgi:hypothetical protein
MDSYLFFLSYVYLNQEYSIHSLNHIELKNQYKILLLHIIQDHLIPLVSAYDHTDKVGHTKSSIFITYLAYYISV